MRDGDLIECDIVGCEFKRVGEKQTRMCELKLKTPDGDELTAAIWLSEKAAGIARAQFKKCGFLIDEQPLSKLHEWIAAGTRRVEIVVESYELRDAVLYRGIIETGANRLGREELDEATSWLRNSKKRDDDGPGGARKSNDDRRQPTPSPRREEPPRRGSPPKRESDYDPDSIPF